MPFDYTEHFLLRSRPADRDTTSHNPQNATPAGYHTP
jgi:hypothetical protein